MYRWQPTNLQVNLLLEVWHSCQHLPALLDPVFNDLQVFQGLVPLLVCLCRVYVADVLEVVQGVHAVFLLRADVVLQHLQYAAGLQSQHRKAVQQQLSWLLCCCQSPFFFLRPKNFTIFF